MRHRTLVGLAGALALLFLPLPAAAGGACTITGTPGNDIFDDGPYGPGVVICGLAGHDEVTELAGGTFKGGPGQDRVDILTDGRFMGGMGEDKVRRLVAGRFEGGAGDDRVRALVGGVSRQPARRLRLGAVSAEREAMRHGPHPGRRDRAEPLADPARAREGGT